MASRGESFMADAISAGWKAEVKIKDGREVVKATFEGKLEIVIVWDGSRYNYGESYQVNIFGARVTLRNAAEARRVLQGASGAVSGDKTSPGRLVRPKRRAKDFDTPDRHIRPPASPRLPFRISSPDRLIIEVVVGKEISWWSRASRSVQCARVMENPKQKHLSIIRAKGKRILNWAAEGEGFRSVCIDDILEVR